MAERAAGDSPRRRVTAAGPKTTPVPKAPARTRAERVEAMSGSVVTGVTATGGAGDTGTVAAGAGGAGSGITGVEEALASALAELEGVRPQFALKTRQVADLQASLERSNHERETLASRVAAEQEKTRVAQRRLENARENHKADADAALAKSGSQQEVISRQAATISANAMELAVARDAAARMKTAAAAIAGLADEAARSLEDKTREKAPLFGAREFRAELENLAGRHAALSDAHGVMLRAAQG